jgi:multicomponent Na+:H+ antiporter subunit A
MIWALLAAHVAIGAAVGVTGDRWGRKVLVVAALPPAVTVVWAGWRAGQPAPVTGDVAWVDGLDLELAFAVGRLSSLLTVVVSGIGMLVLVYSAGYFSPGSGGLGRFSATLLAFSAAMVGLVWADSLWTLFVFWELTSVTSFLLIGHRSSDPAARLAARRALLVTAVGGLMLLAGLVVLADAAGTARLSQMGPVGGTTGTVAAILILGAAATKSAQVPFHVWLPGAMAAPTPVSAYLHSATMVKAGVVLVAVTAPVLGQVGVWKPLGVTLGLASMVWGAVGALRHRDAKLILAWGTVSQLGLMIALLAVGTGKAAFAAIALLAAHAVSKAALFMIVGEIDVRAGTRHIDQLSGLWRSMPTTCAVAVLSGASMAGVPPLLGFPAKEAAIEAVLGLPGVEAWLVAGTVIVGSVLTVAYTVRLLLGLFGSAPGSTPTPVEPGRSGMSAPLGVLGAASFVGFALLGVVTGIVRSAAVEIDPAAEAYSLLRWPGLTTALVISIGIIAAGALGGAWLGRRSRRVPGPIGADIADVGIDAVLAGARRLTGRIQHGSLPFYLATMAATASLATVPLAFAVDTGSLYWWDSSTQAVLAVLVVAAAVNAAVIGSRLGAALGLGAVGLGVAGLFVSHGAPDLALTQLLVETVIVVGFVVGLGHLTSRFPPVGRVWRGVRIVVASLVGAAVTLGLLAAASNQAAAPPTEALVAGAVAEGGGNNVVNVILTDIRALDTLGEVVVLAVVAIGLLALARPRPRSISSTELAEEPA